MNSGEIVGGHSADAPERFLFPGWQERAQASAPGGLAPGAGEGSATVRRRSGMITPGKSNSRPVAR